MKIFIYVISLFFLTLSTMIKADELAAPYYFLQKVGEVENFIFNYDKNDIHTNVVTVGETYSYANSQIDINTSTNSSAFLTVVGKITMAMDENVQVKIHTSSITVDNLKDFPTIVKISNKILVCSLMNGVCDIINSDTNGSISIQTPRVPIVLKKGKYRIVVQGKTTVLAVIDGLATIHNTIESKSPIQITSGNFAHVSTYYSLSTKGLDTLNNGKATVSIKPIQADDLKKIQTSCDQLDVLKNNIVFCVIDKKIVGVKLTD